jgi:molecular chaperone GrpE
MTPSQKQENTPESPEPEMGDSVGFGSDAPPEAPQDTAEQEIARLKEENAKLRDQWVRTAAEAENVRKRAQREMEDTARYAVTGFARDMVSVLENLSRAHESIPSDAAGDNELMHKLREGIDLTLRELLSIFQKFGIVRIAPLNQKFDHNFHQAVAQAERDDVPPGTVVQVIQAGYVIHDRLLRPAMVVVSKAVDPAKKVDTVA